MLSLSDRAPTFPQAAYLDGEYQASATVTGPVIFTNFIVSSYYWTSTTDAADPTQAWTVYSCDFGVYNIAKTDVRHALAVRSRREAETRRDRRSKDPMADLSAFAITRKWPPRHPDRLQLTVS